ncbi:unnamed protein product [Cyprideis torosa]|uniref:Uncharacterized protein n=1 Tax=Cyprideis torosa TaxID=163714 RepID=A0A7R8WC83_9CRUS|nr:unnamed protein product [Cyprideis torosa]CAG0891712.1 unnamed protein product [Cyprideis torosa]
MKYHSRCFLLAFSTACFILLREALRWYNSWHGGGHDEVVVVEAAPSFLEDDELRELLGVQPSSSGLNPGFCSMDRCFDFARCRDPSKKLRIHVYPEASLASRQSVLFRRIVRIIQHSDFHTSDPAQACLFLLNLDTLDRDVLSGNFVPSIPSKIAAIPEWNGGQNHLLFNLYAGTWPDYREELGFDTGKAILVRASPSVSTFREGFDISFPLIHKEHRDRGRQPGKVTGFKVPGLKKYKIGFKGKRYTFGIGSETRNRLMHLHNGKDVVLVTTCRHGKSWEENKDDHCDKDEELFNR